LSDGAYLIAWPSVAALGPPAALITGFLLGWLRFAPGETFTFSLVLMALMIAISSFSAGIGVWLCAGYAAGDFFLFRPTLLSSETFAEEPLVNLIHIGGPALILYLLLANLVVLAPHISSAVRRQTMVRAKTLFTWFDVTVLVTPLGMICNAAVYASLVYIWTQSVPALIRPVWTWAGDVPLVEAMAPLQEMGARLVYVSLVLGSLRVVLEYSALRRFEVLVPLHVWDTLLNSALASSRVRLPSWASALGMAFLITFMLSGLLSTWIEAVLFASAVGLVMIGRGIIADRLKTWTATINWVPVIVRVVACWWVSYVVSSLILSSSWGETDSFRPLLIATVVSLAVFALLVPPAAERDRSAEMRYKGPDVL
jgi:hypothetical protein